MRPIVSITMKNQSLYRDSGFIRSIKDRFSIKRCKDTYIYDLDLYIKNMQIPSNIGIASYNTNILSAKKHSRVKDYVLSLSGMRIIDYNLYNMFQKKLFAYSVVRSIQMILSLKHKNIKNSCIVFYDVSHEMIKGIIYEAAKVCNYIIILSDNNQKCRSLREYVTCEYGIAPVICTDLKYAACGADFIIMSKNINTDIKDKPVWYVDNMVPAVNSSALNINNISYFVPWEENINEGPEILGAILSQMEERDICKALKYNGVYIDEIKFNNQIISIS